jgi:hypothetical protein
MTQDEIIRMAREAGLGNVAGGIDGLDEVTHFAALVAEATKKECALQALSDIHQEIEKPQGDDDLTIAYMVGYEKGKDYTKEKAAKIADAELMNTNMLTSLPPKSSAAWNIAAAIRSVK